MKFCTVQHKHCCGVNLHARTMFLRVLDERGYPLLEKNIKTDPELFLKAIEPYREDLVVAVEFMFTWYWLSDLCSREQIPFILGHALCMRAIHGGKAKNDRVDANKIAVLLRGGMFPVASWTEPDRDSTTLTAPTVSSRVTGRLGPALPALIGSPGTRCHLPRSLRLAIFPVAPLTRS